MSSKAYICVALIVVLSIVTGTSQYIFNSYRNTIPRVDYEFVDGGIRLYKHYKDDYGRVQERQEFVRMAPYGDYQVEYLTTDKFHYGRDGGKPIGYKSVSIRILSNNGIIHEDFASSRL